MKRILCSLALALSLVACGQSGSLPSARGHLLVSLSNGAHNGTTELDLPAGPYVIDAVGTVSAADVAVELVVTSPTHPQKPLAKATLHVTPKDADASPGDVGAGHASVTVKASSTTAISLPIHWKGATVAGGVNVDLQFGHAPDISGFTVTPAPLVTAGEPLVVDVTAHNHNGADSALTVTCATGGTTAALDWNGATFVATIPAPPSAGAYELVVTATDDTGAQTAGSKMLQVIPSTDVPSFAKDLRFYAVPMYDQATQGEPKTALDKLQVLYGGHTVVVNADSTTADIFVTLDSMVPELKAQAGEPDAYTCAAIPEDGPAGCLTSTPGTSPLPGGIDDGWAGAKTGGCGTWAVAMCNRVLGDTDASTPVSKDEWNQIAGAIGQDAAGGSSTTNQGQYYANKGYSVETKRFGGSAADYAELKSKLSDDHCDVKLAFWKRNADGTYTNGHTETVTGVDAAGGSAQTNSWGQTGTIKGGSDGAFSHDKDGTSFKDAAGNGLWPAGSTEVEVQYVCEKGALEKLADLLGL